MKSDVVYKLIRTKIENEDRGWCVGDEIKNESDLARKFNVARATLRVALKRLADDGFLTRGRGKLRKVCKPDRLSFAPESFAIQKRLGMIGPDIKDMCEKAPLLREALSLSTASTTSFGQSLQDADLSPSDDPLQFPKTVKCALLAAEHRLNVAEICKALNVTQRGRVIWCLRLRKANDRPMALQWSVIAEQPLGPTGPRIIVPPESMRPGGLTEVFEQHGIRRAYVTVAIRPGRPSAEDAMFLGVDTDAPLMEEHRVSYTFAGPDSKVLFPYEYLTTLYTPRMELVFSWAEMMPAYKDSATTKQSPKKAKRRRTSR